MMALLLTSVFWLHADALLQTQVAVRELAANNDIGHIRFSKSKGNRTMISTLRYAPGVHRPEDSPADPLRVFILAGQSNMEGQGVVDLDHTQHYNGGKGTLLHVMKAANSTDKFKHTQNSDGTWKRRDDVFVRFKARHALMKGPLTIGYTGYPGRHHIGPEFQFGHVVGQHFTEPVLLIKTAWGGKSLFKDFRPPSSGAPGPYYKQMLQEIDEALESIRQDFPQLGNRKPEIAGFVWMQGWNDMVSKQATAEYETNLVNFIKDVRKHLKQPDLPFVVGELGNGGRSTVSEGMLTFRRAQKAACEQKEFHGNVVFVPTAEFARPASESPNVTHGHHWFGNAESYFLIGDALARAMLKMLAENE